MSKSRFPEGSFARVVYSDPSESVIFRIFDNGEVVKLGPSRTPNWAMAYRFDSDLRRIKAYKIKYVNLERIEDQEGAQLMWDLRKETLDD